MLRETKIGILVACCFLGLLGTVIALKYNGDPLAAEMSAAGTPDSSSWLEQPTPVAPENVVPVPPTTPVPGPSVASPPATPGIQPLSNPNEIKLVSAPGKPSVELASNPATPSSPPARTIEERRTTPLVTEQPAPTVPPSEPAGPPVPAMPPASETLAKSEQPTPAASPEPTPPAAASSTTPKTNDPLTIPKPEEVIDPLASRATTPGNSGTDGSVPAVAALAGAAVPPTPAITPAATAPAAPPAATLGVPAPSPGPAANNSPEIKPSSIPNTPPLSTALVAATPPPATGALAVSPPIRVPTPATAALIVPQVASFDEETYQCRPGDTIKSIATQHYHSDKYEQALLQYNRDYPLATENIRTNPANLPPGQPIYVPQVKVLESRYPSLIPSLTPLPQPAVAVATPPAPARAYRVSAPAGEMMRDIAGRSLGNAERWVDIYRMNPKYDPAQPVPAGVVLQMPADAKP